MTELKKKLEPLTDNMTEKEIKDVMKSAITEWMDDKFLAFGKWTAIGVAAMALAALTYFILTHSGWKQATP
jgi:hypothetical protein